jgi:tetraacyldisaccharide 4'-kinase
VRRSLLPFVPLYAAAAGARSLAYAQGWAKPHGLRNPVVSIGNLSVGGSGKTPLTIRLAELLSERGIGVDILSRGYGRVAQRVERVDPTGSAAEFGDEPLLMARSTGVPVYVAPGRYDAGTLAERELPGPRVHLLDDGFQHRQLARAVDIVVLHRTDLTEGLLPAGRLREPLTALARAHILVLRDGDGELEAELRRRGLEQLIWWTTRRVEAPPVQRIVAFCAIARPDEFFSALRSQGITVTATCSWRDHCRYGDGKIASLQALGREHGAEAFLTTEKDLVRISPEQRKQLESTAPLLAAKLIVRLRDEAAAVAELLDRVAPFAGPGAQGAALTP